MRLVSKKISGKILFYKLRAARWAERAAELGLSPEETATLEAKVQAAVTAAQEQRAAMMLACTKTQTLRFAVDALTEYGSSLLAKIKGKARQDGGDIYVAASISMPDKASPIGPPGRPFGFGLTLQQVGVVELTWKCDNPRGSVGTIYQVSRQLDGKGPFQCLGATGAKSFVDATLPAGTTQVTYQVQAMRSTKVGPAARHTVNIGVSGDGLPHVQRSPGGKRPKALLAA